MFTATFSNLPEDAYTFTAWGSSFQDLVGLWLDGEASAWPTGNGLEGGDFVVNFVTDADTRALPTPLVDLPPSGAQVQQTPYATSGAITTAGDTDDFTITLNAGQKAYGGRDRRPRTDSDHNVARSLRR